MHESTSFTTTHQPTQHQRLATFTAAHARSIFPIAKTFADRFNRACPGANLALPINSRSERFTFARSVSNFCRQIANPNASHDLASPKKVDFALLTPRRENKPETIGFDFLLKSL